MNLPQTNNRDNISLEETLAFIRYLNRQQPFDRQEIHVPTHDIEQPRTKQLQPAEKSKKQKAEQLSDEGLTKKINKNRAIKRIIQSAYQILQNFHSYEEEDSLDSNVKSSEIQFNIYLKQFNRVLELIFNLQKNKIKVEQEQTQQREQVLQNIYEYTVVEDFRQILPVAIIKDKISKTNIEIMIQSLTKSLMVLKSNQLRIYNQPKNSSVFKSIKLHEIENVDYHVQPYIFMVLAIQKDKERFNVYIQFQSEKNQEKWDRAFYCCYIGKKMRTKEKFFIIQYPEEDVKKKEKDEIKKYAAFNYEVSEGMQPLESIYREGTRPLSDISREDRQNSSELSPSHVGRGKPVSSKSKDELLEDGTSKERRMTSSIALLENKSKKLTELDSETNRLLEVDRSRNNLMDRHKTVDDIERNNQITSNVLKIESNMDITDRRNSKTHIFGSYGNIIEQTNLDAREDNEQLNQLHFQKEDDLPDEIKQIHDIERRNVKGLVFEKEKFFFNKNKILFLKEGTNPNKESRLEEQEGQEPIGKKIDVQGEYEAMMFRELQYWDFDGEQGIKSQQKVIKVKQIKSYSIQEEKMLTLLHDKQMKLLGPLDSLNEVVSWIQLLQDIYKGREGQQVIDIPK